MYDYRIIHLYSETIPRLGLYSHKSHSEKCKLGNTGYLPSGKPKLVSLHDAFQPGFWSERGLTHPRPKGKPTAWPRSSLHLPHWSVRTHPLVWLSRQWLHRHGGSSSQQGRHKRSASGLSSHISEATSWSPRCPLGLSQRMFLILFLELQFISAVHIL